MQILGLLNCKSHSSPFTVNTPRERSPLLAFKIVKRFAGISVVKCRADKNCIPHLAIFFHQVSKGIKLDPS
ncbi:hypothetical protein Pfo_014803 [Paulownia fortunei]|nr:hypothetical protein Pfo_014803 [Paulownia fortunei]